MNGRSKDRQTVIRSWPEISALPGLPGRASARRIEPERRAWFALRRTMPPWRFKENLAELVRACPRFGVDEVIVKVDTEEFSHGIPTLEWVRNYLP